jgi:hypothetical protein
VDVKIYHYVGLIPSGIGCRPGDMCHAMMLVYGGDCDIAFPHFLRPYRPIARIALRHDLLELIVVLSGHHPGRRRCYEVGGIQRCDLIHVCVAAKRLFEKALVPLEQLPDAGFHHLLSKCSLYGAQGQTQTEALSALDSARRLATFRGMQRIDAIPRCPWLGVPRIAGS